MCVAVDPEAKAVAFEFSGNVTHIPFGGFSAQLLAPKLLAPESVAQAFVIRGSDLQVKPVSPVCPFTIGINTGRKGSRR